MNIYTSIIYFNKRILPEFSSRFICFSEINVIFCRSMYYLEMDVVFVKNEIICRKTFYFARLCDIIIDKIDKLHKKWHIIL